MQQQTHLTTINKFAVTEWVIGILCDLIIIEECSWSLIDDEEIFKLS